LNADWAALTRQIKEASDIVAVVGSYLTLHPAGQTFKAVCPFHNDHKPSLDVDPRRQRYRCWACGKVGDAISFVQEYEKVDFVQARAILASRAGIAIEAGGGVSDRRHELIRAMKWADGQYQNCLTESSAGERARIYLGERKLTGPTVRKFGLGFAPGDGQFLCRLGQSQQISPDTLAEVGLIGERQNGEGWYDRFRDRVMFPIHDVRGQTVGFGGRILPNSPSADRSAKYYNSSETPIFSKSDLLFGLDFARSAAATAGCLAIVEGYTDVMMSHQHGIENVVATMGTALNHRHLQQITRYAPRVVLVFDADEGGTTGVDRALELFIRHDVHLTIAALPDSLDPCDWLSASGPEGFRKALDTAVDALEYKLNRLIEKESSGGVTGTIRIVDGILKIMAASPPSAGQAAKIREQLLVTRICQRMGLSESAVRDRLEELRRAGMLKDREEAAIERERDRQREREAGQGAGQSRSILPGPGTPEGDANRKTAGPAPMLERQLLEIILAEPALVAEAAREVTPEQMTHPGLRKLLECLYMLKGRNEPPELDALRVHIPHPALIARAMEMQEIGRTTGDRAKWLRTVLDGFHRRKVDEDKKQLRERLHFAGDDAQALDLLRQIQKRSGVADAVGQPPPPTSAAS